jgi:hypothetical protein
MYAFTEIVFKEKHVGVDFNTLYLIANSVVSYPSPLQREKVGWGRFLQLALAFPKQPI